MYWINLSAKITKRCVCHDVKCVYGTYLRGKKIDFCTFLVLKLEVEEPTFPLIHNVAVCTPTLQSVSQCAKISDTLS